jgi:agmatinase
MPAIALLGIPWDGDSSWRPGAALGPAAIRAERDRVRQFSSMRTEAGVDLDQPGLIIDAGDVPATDPAATREAITDTVAGLIHGGHRVLALGGDHSVTYPVLRAVHNSLGRVDVLHFDAHPDLYPEFEGNRFSHACPFARSLEDGLIGRLVQLGLRSQNPTLKAMAERYNVEQFWMKDWAGPPRLTFERPVYISLDLDGLDPAFAPGVSHPEPGGLSVRDVIGTLQRLEGRVVAGDLVEYNPDADWDGRTAVVAVKLLKEMLQLMV